MKKAVYILMLLILIISVGRILINSGATDDAPQDEQTQRDEEETIASSRQEQAADDEAKELASDEQTDDESIGEQLKEVIVDTIKDSLTYFNNNKSHIVAIGDSLTRGVGDTTEGGGYVGILERTINNEGERNVTIDHFGKRGSRSDQLYKRLDEPEITAAIGDADMVLITIGANDIMKVLKDNVTNLTMEPFNAEQKHYKKRLQAIIDKIQSVNAHADIYLIGFYNPFEQYFQHIEELDTIVNNWNDVSANIAAENDAVTFIPTADLFVDSDVALFADDHFHPNYLGYYRIARRVLEYITEE